MQLTHPIPCPDAARVVADNHSQVEYLVVVYSKDESPVLLSLRQADILEALASDKTLTAKGGCVPALQDVPGAR